MRILALALLALPACTQPQMRGFGGLVPTTEQVALTGLGGRARGDFALGTGATGRFERALHTRSDAQDEFGHPLGNVDRAGRARFSVSGPGVSGTLSGECASFVAEYRDRTGTGSLSLETTETAVPLGYRCRFARDGRPVGMLTLGELPPRGLQVIERRAGAVMLDGRRLELVSEHKPDGPVLGGGFQTPLGYRFEEYGRAVGMANLNGARVLALPRDPATRDVALAAGIALALFWDPSDF